MNAATITTRITDRPSKIRRTTYPTIAAPTSRRGLGP
jgi:hypothetical protein